MSTLSAVPALENNDVADVNLLVHSDDGNLANQQPVAQDRQTCSTSVHTEYNYANSSSASAPTVASPPDYEHKIFKKPATDTLKLLVADLEHLRCPFLVPILESVDILESEDEPFYELISPRMLGGTLQARLLHGEPISCNELIRIMYQIVQGIAFLHSRNIVHGNLHPGKVVFDEHGNVRLVDYGMCTAYSAEETVRVRKTDNIDPTKTNTVIQSNFCFCRDLKNVAQIWLICRYTPAKYFMIPKCLHNLRKAARSIDRRGKCSWSCWKCLTEVMWPIAGEKYFREIVQVLVKCFLMECDRNAASQLTVHLKSLVESAGEVKFVVGEDSTKCLYCTVEPVHRRLRSSCPENCQFLGVCSSCLHLFASNCYSSRVNSVVCWRSDAVTTCEEPATSDLVETFCPVDGHSIEPVIGGMHSYALILYEDGDAIGGTTKNDALNMVQLATHSIIMQMPSCNVYMTKMSKKTDMEFSEELCKHALTPIQHGEPSFFLFYFSGHDLFLTRDIGIKKLVKTLKGFIRQIAMLCPRILMIFDCCEASRVADLFKVKDLTDDLHVEWHYQWMSCGKKQVSYIDNDLHSRRLSRFSELVFRALKGATKTPCPLSDQQSLNDQNCDGCSKFRKSCASGYVKLNDARNFVTYHIRRMTCVTESGKLAAQDPVLKGVGHRKPIVAFFNQEPCLYKLHVKDMKSGDVHMLQTDNLHYRNIWHRTVAYRDKQACKLALYNRHCSRPLFQASKRVVDAEDRRQSDKKMRYIGRVLDAASRDNKCFVVKFVAATATAADNDDNDEEKKDVLF